MPPTGNMVGHMVNGVQNAIRLQEIPTTADLLPGGGGGPCLRIQSQQKILFF